MSLTDTSSIAPLRHPTLADVIDSEARRHRRRSIALWSSAAFVVAAAAVGIAWLRPVPPSLAERFRTQAISHGPVVREVHATGHAEAFTTVQIGAEISGRIARVEVDFNQNVQSGQVLARFDRAALQAQLAQADAAAANARTTLELAKAELLQAARVRDRVRRLHGEGSSSAAELESTESGATLAGQRVLAAEAHVAAQEAARSLARTNLEHAEIRSPIQGVIITRNVDPGQAVASVLQSPTLFTVAADLRMMRVLAAVDEADIGEIREGQPATFTVNAYPGRVFEGVVSEVRNSPVVVQDVVTYSTVIDTENLDLALKPGMTASARIRTASLPDAVRVPNAALHFHPPQTPLSNEPGVWVIEGEQLRRVAVKAGLSDGELTAIDRGELQPGAQVIVELTPAGRSAYDIGS
jgi:HlyD family secretion protein